jgi:recombinational DNA repair protein RecR
MFKKEKLKPKQMFKVVKTVEAEISQCWYCCPYFEVQGHDMICTHPKLDPKYFGLIITQSNSRNGNFPEECPLRKE